MSVEVAVRSRPLNREEIDCGASIIVRMNQSQVEVMDSSQGRGQKFAFDHAFWSTNAIVPGNKNPVATQEMVFGILGKEALEHTFTGYNGCIFAYGQTGSGKTYSMMGDNTDEGLIPRIAVEIFRQSSVKQATGAEVCVEVSFLEIYNERVRCLLCPVTESVGADPIAETHPLRVREHPVHGPYVEGLAKFVVRNKDEFLRLMHDGNKVRTTAATAMNAQSSRSHAVFQVTVTSKKKMGTVETTTKSKLNLVDLAGSERADKSMATGTRLTEGSNINRSLSALGMVISNLADEFETGKTRHIPYRDSVLTWILKDNLGGNSKTVMLATISPASAQYEETMSTLRYAERAKKIQLKAKINESNNNEVVAALQKEIEALKAQLKTADGESRLHLADQLAVSEAFEHDLAATLETKLAETQELMKEREAHMKELEAELKRHKATIESLETINTEKDRKISALLQKIAERESSTSSASEEIERMRLQIAELEVQRDSDAAREKKRQQEAANARLRAEDMGNVASGVQVAAGGKVSVKALARAFDTIATAPQQAPVKKTVTDLPEPKKLPHILQQAMAKESAKAAAAGASGATDTQPAPTDEVELEDENVLECLEDDLQIEEPEIELDDDEVQLDDEEPTPAPAQDDDIQLDDDDAKHNNDIELDDAEGEHANGGGGGGDDDVVLDDDEADKAKAAKPQDDDDDVQIDDDDAPAAAAAKPQDANAAATPAKAVMTEECTTSAHTGASTSADIDQPVSAPKGGVDSSGNATTRQRAETVTAQKAKPNVTGTTSVATISVPSHALPNNRFLREPFKVIKIDDTAIIGGKKERIWDVDFFGKKFANLDMTGYESFSQPSSNLFRVEKDMTNPRKLTMYFFDAQHPYDLEFTSTERRQRFYELAMLQRRNSILWCPSLCPEGENDVVLNVQGTTIDRPNGKVLKAKGDVKFMIARMPYEVIDLYYGCFSLQDKPLPKSSAVLSSFIPKTMHEVYVVGITDVPKDLMGKDEIANYLLAYLGASTYFVLANTATDAKARSTNNVMLILVRRSFIVRVSHVEAAEVPAARKEGVQKGDFTAVCCSMKINEASIAVILVNANPAITDPGLRAGCIRSLMANFPFGNVNLDIGSRFDYVLCSGAFGFRNDFTENDMLKKQMKAGNLMSDFVESEPHPSLAATTNPFRVLTSVKPRVCRFDVKQYQTSRAMSVPNVFVTADVFCQRAFLSTFGEQVPRCQFILTSVNVLGHRIPHINSPELQVFADWLESSPAVVPLVKQGEAYTAVGKTVPPLAPVVSNFDFLRLQSLDFTILGILPAARDKKKLVIASATLPLKNSFSLGETVDFSVPLYYRACNVGFLNGTILQVHAEKNDVDMQSSGILANERDAHVVSCYENQVLDDQGTWTAAMYPDNGAWDWSSVKDPAIQQRRESFQLPDPDKWKWLTQWRHEARADNVDGWTYSTDFKSPFELRRTKALKARRRRWTRVMQAEDALVLHNYLDSLRAAAPAATTSTSKE